MQFRHCTSAVVLAVLALSGMACAQQSAPVAAQPGPNTQQFNLLFTQLKALAGQLEELGQKFQTAEPDERTEIAQQGQALFEKQIALQEQVIKVAEKAYLEAPNANDDVTSVMVQVLIRAVSSDHYEEGLRLAGLLLKNQCKEPAVYDLAGIAAFATHDFDAAEGYLKVAKEKGAITSMGEQYLSLVPEYKQAWAKEAAIREAEAQADDLPRVLLKTNKGDIELELFENEAPKAVANFVSLVEKGFYNGLTFHRVIPNFMAQGGCPQGNGTGGPGYNIPCECYQPNHRLHFRGSLSMAHAGRDTGGSQFFLTFLPTKHLDGKHTVFGRVSKGMDVLADLQARDPMDPASPEPDKIIEAKVTRKRAHEYVPTKVEKPAEQE